MAAQRLQTNRSAGLLFRLYLMACCFACWWPSVLLSQTLFIGDHAVLAGSPVKVPVVLGGAAGLASAAMTVNYDPQVLALDGVTNGSLGQSFSLAWAKSEGSVRVVAAGDTVLSAGSGSLVVLQFHANPGALPGLSSPITLADRVLGGQYGRDLAWSQAATHRNGTVTVVSPSLDSNSNGLPDWWEERYFGGPTNADPVADSDGDGVSNLQEFLAGTDPTAPKSVFCIQSFLPTSDGFQLAFPSVSGKSYQVEFSDDLSHWGPLSSPIRGTGETIYVSTDPALSSGARFYRVTISP